MKRRAWVLIACVAAGLGLIVWPAHRAGQFGFVVTSGRSMEPRFHSGDLAFVWRAHHHYDIGDIAAYRSTELHVTVLHRIVGRDGPRFVFKGDHNPWRDADQPLATDIVGRLAVQIPHGGTLLRLFVSPGALGLIGGSMIVSGGSSRRRRPRRRGGEPAAARVELTIAGPGSHRMAAAARFVCPPQEAVAVALAVGVLALAVAAFGYSLPTTRPAVHQLSYRQQATLSYNAYTERSAVYPAGQLKLPDPVYLRLVQAVTVRIGYSTTLHPAGGVTGRRLVRVVITGGTGWQRIFTLQPQRVFAGPDFGTDVLLHVGHYQKTIAQAEKAAGGSLGPYTLSLITKITLRGQVDGVGMQEVFSPTLNFGMDGTQLRLQDQAADGAVVRSQAGSVLLATRRARMLSLPGPDLSVSTARALGTALAAIAFGVAVLLFALRRMMPDGDVLAGRQAGLGGERLPRRVRPRLVSAPAALIGGDRTVVTVDSIVALDRVAQRYERLIVHSVTQLPDGGGLEQHTFLVDDDTAVYRYQTHALTSVPIPAGRQGTGLNQRVDPAAAPAAVLIPAPRRTDLLEQELVTAQATVIDTPTDPHLPSVHPAQQMIDFTELR